MSNETPQVVDKRRFTNLEMEEPVAAEKGTIWHLRSDGDYENRETGDVVPHGMFPEPSEGQDSWRVGPHVPPTAQFSPSSQPSSSPGMDFGTALKQVLRGQPVTRMEWENPSIYLLLYRCRVPNFGVEDGNYLSIHRADGTVGPLFVSDSDLRADDWIVVV